MGLVFRGRGSGARVTGNAALNFWIGGVRDQQATKFSNVKRRTLGSR